MYRKIILSIMILGVVGIFSAGGCHDEDEETIYIPIVEPNFPITVRIENVTQLITQSGVFDTPAGATIPAVALPGEAFEFTVTSAVQGDYLSFLTMFVQSNDLFFAPMEMGIELFQNGTAISGDITNFVKLWDAGTEVNQEPGTGLDQAPRQAGPDTGADELGAVVSIESANDGYMYPAVRDVINVFITPSTTTTPADFVVRIENVSTDTTLSFTGGTAAVPLSPGLWVVHKEPGALFYQGMPEPGLGLEAIAEDGDPSSLDTAITALIDYQQPISPGIWVLHTPGVSLFAKGAPDSGIGLESLAEDGDPTSLLSSLTSVVNGQILATGSFTSPVGEVTPGPASNGMYYEFQINSVSDLEDLRLSIATMYVQSNDLFFATMPEGIKIHQDMKTINSDVTCQFKLWDAGTELNQEPGIGLDQPPRQAVPNTGASENGTIRSIENVNDGFTYPNVYRAIKVTIR